MSQCILIVLQIKNCALILSLLLSAVSTPLKLFSAMDQDEEEFLIIISCLIASAAANSVLNCATVLLQTVINLLGKHKNCQSPLEVSYVF